ncbi:hypothetical protein P691DRAFT_725347 [Macrolepiota fuliginosa MF-IS2]|uniref:Uncharacterized protein n=1 Tax=Macrolepiota fuliginosa MF-IS2 TaxID=1400762 RepID=A0A9P5XJP3_9AGAR|nr:hypothetical protein P691DRAFT_725347 [Macrolepiota fuliginosa MF-IS2]
MRIVSPALFVTFSALWMVSTAEPVNVPRLPSDIGTAISGFVGSVADTFSSESLEKLWKDVQGLGSQAGHIVLDEVTKTYSETSQVIGEFSQAVNNLVDQAHEVQGELQTLVKKRDITIEHVTELLSQQIGEIYGKLKDETQAPLPEDREERRKARAQLVAQVTEQARVAYVYVVAEKLGAPKEQAERHCDGFLPMITRVVLLVGNIIDEHPILLEALIIAATFLLSDILIFRPILNLFGFGLLGPVKGSPAAQLQRIFFGGAVTRGSWFAVLQGLGMTVAGGWLGKAAASAGLAAILGLATKSGNS